MMPSAHQNFISHAQAQARILLDMYGRLLQMNELWAGDANYDGLIDQAAIDTVPSFEESGLTVTNLTEGVYGMGLIRGNINTYLQHLTILANLP